MQTKFTVGELAKINGLTKQMLIFYDRENVFKPKIVDQINNYRYYTADQLEELDSILILRDMGLSLKEIKEYMLNRNSENTLEILKQQRETINKKLIELENMQKRITYKITSIEEFVQSKNLDVFVKMKQEYLAIKPVLKPYDLVAADVAIKRLLKQALDCNYQHYYQLGTIVTKEALLNKDYLKYTYALVPLLKPCEKKNLFIKVQGIYARAYHVGTYESVAKTYAMLLDKINKNDYQIIGYGYEFCVLDCLTTKDPSEYITEIQIHVEKKQKDLT